MGVNPDTVGEAFKTDLESLFVAYLTKIQSVQIGERTYQMRSLIDHSQSPDIPLIGDSEDSNHTVNLNNWPLFGQLWPVGIVMAEWINDMDLTGLHILEVGCGLALAGMVAHSKGADVTVSDFNPDTKDFLDHNLALNHLPPLRYIEANWCDLYPELGTFDLVIASDVLYDRDHPKLLADFLKRHLKQTSRVIVTDPGRGNYRQFTKEMALQGFDCTTTMKKLTKGADSKAQCRLLDYRRSDAAQAI